MRINPDEKTVAAMDLLVPRVGELIGGSQREERLQVCHNLNMLCFLRLRRLTWLFIGSSQLKAWLQVCCTLTCTACCDAILVPLGESSEPCWSPSQDSAVGDSFGSNLMKEGVQLWPYQAVLSQQPAALLDSWLAHW